MSFICICSIHLHGKSHHGEIIIHAISLLPCYVTFFCQQSTKFQHLPKSLKGDYPASAHNIRATQIANMHSTNLTVFWSLCRQSAATWLRLRDLMKWVTSLSRLVEGAKQPVASHMSSHPRSSDSWLRLSVSCLMT